MAQRRASQLAIGYSPNWLRQSAWDVPVDQTELTRAFPATSRNYFDINTTIEDIDDCTGEDLLLELVTAEEARLNIDFDVDPDILAGIAAFAYGVAAAPTGGTSEVQLETITATGGTRTLTVQIGANAQTTPALAYNATEATIQAALDALSNVGAGDIVVDDTDPDAIVYTFASALATQDVNVISVNTYFLTGGTSVFSTTTPGIGKTHAITRLTSYALPLMTLYLGFRGSSEQPYIFKNVVVNSFRVRAASREKVTCSVELIGSADLVQATGYTMPECQDIVPIRFGDCQVSVGGVDFVASNIAREFEYYFQNDVTPKFDGSAIYATRHERADKRPSQLSMFILGEPGDGIWDLAKARTFLDAFIRCGPAGRHVKFNAPGAIFKLAPTPIRFGGDPPESELALISRPKKTIGLASTPTNVTAVIGTTATLLTADS
jgi:hypothetical protein